MILSYKKTGDLSRKCFFESLMNLAASSISSSENNVKVGVKEMGLEFKPVHFFIGVWRELYKLTTEND